MGSTVLYKMGVFRKVIFGSYWLNVIINNEQK